jgi:glycine/D-amino acid oxidase-like deaminating enzyme
VNRDGVVKIAHHGAGRPMHPESLERVVTADETRRLREFLRDTFPLLAAAPISFPRVCLYADTTNGHFLIARDPAREGLVVATGDSGHGFKFAPVLGDIVADAIEGVTSPLLDKFCWRPGLQAARTEEAARFQG